MSDISILGGALGLGNASYDPKEAKGYLETLDTRGKAADAEVNEATARRRGALNETKGYLGELKGRGAKLEKDYGDVVAERRAKVNQMQQIVEDATKALLETRANRINLPMLAAGSAMMMPSSTGGLGASLGQAGLTAAPYIAADRRSADENIMRTANLKSLPLSMGEAVDADLGRMISGRLGANDQNRASTMAGVLSASDNIDKDVQSQASRRGDLIETQKGAVTRGMLTAQTTGMKAVQKEAADMRKEAALEAKNRIAAAIRDGTTYDGDNAEVEGKLTDAIYAQMFKQRYGVWPNQATAGKDMSPQELEASVPKMPRSIPKETKQERDTYTSISNLGGTAEQNLSALDFAEPTERPQVPGMLAGPALWASKLAEAVGLEGDWGKTIADAGNDVGKMQAVMRNFVLTMQKDQKGVQTEGDAKRMQEAIASTSNTAQLNKLMFSWMRSQALAAKWQADIADEYVKGNKNRTSGINAHMNDKGRTTLVRPGTNGAKVTLWEYVDGFKKLNPEMKRDEAERKAIDMWNSL